MVDHRDVRRHAVVGQFQELVAVLCLGDLEAHHRAVFAFLDGESAAHGGTEHATMPEGENHLLGVDVGEGTRQEHLRADRRLAYLVVGDDAGEDLPVDGVRPDLQISLTEAGGRHLRAIAGKLLSLVCLGSHAKTSYAALWGTCAEATPGTGALRPLAGMYYVLCGVYYISVKRRGHHSAFRSART